MDSKQLYLIEKLKNERSLTLSEYEHLIKHKDEEGAALLREEALKARRSVYGDTVFIRGLIEISNICKNDCLYCGIRRSNTSCERYRLTEAEILSCCDEGYSLGFRTFVMQGGEDPYFNDDVMCSVIKKIADNYPDCAITLSLGERSKESYKRLFDSGANRYLLRHETADSEHYSKLHPKEMSLYERIECLNALKEIGFQAGCGFMVGSPFQTEKEIALDLKFTEEFKPQMCGVGPFIPHRATPFHSYPKGSAELTCYLLSIIRLINPSVLLPSTTALATAEENGHEMGLKSGANVIMSNLSPESVRKKYELYNGKKSFGDESAQAVRKLSENVKKAGFYIVTARGDYITNSEKEG